MYRSSSSLFLALLLSFPLEHSLCFISLESFFGALYMRSAFSLRSSPSIPLPFNYLHHLSLLVLYTRLLLIYVSYYTLPLGIRSFVLAFLRTAPFIVRCVSIFIFLGLSLFLLHYKTSCLRPSRTLLLFFRSRSLTTLRLMSF